MATLTNNGKMIKDVRFSLKNPKYFKCILFLFLHFINGMRNKYLSPLPYINNINYFKKMMSIFLTVSNTNYILR